MSNKNYAKVIEECKVIIETNYAHCGLKESVEKRILELVQEWEKCMVEADKRGKTIGGLRVIFMDLLRATNKAEDDSKKYKKEKCDYLRKGSLWTVKSRTGRNGA